MVAEQDDNPRHRILAIWAHPRARSSAFGRMMCERGEFQVKDEPFAKYYYFSDERVSKRRTDVKPDARYRFAAIEADLLQEAESNPLFIKDHAYHVVSRADEAFLAQWQNTFLIRHPAQSLPSLYARMPDFSLQETGYAESLRLFQLAAKAAGQTPIVIDADDLVNFPERTIQAYCEAAGIEYCERSLRWNAGLPCEMSADWGDWYTHLRKSRGFARQSNPDYVAVEETEATRRAYEHCLPYYQQLHKHRLRIGEQAV